MKTYIVEQRLTRVEKKILLKKIKYLKGLNLPGVDLGNEVLVPLLDEVLSLGVILDCSLTWRPHINHQCLACGSLSPVPPRLCAGDWLKL